MVDGSTRVDTVITSFHSSDQPAMDLCRLYWYCPHSVNGSQVSSSTPNTMKNEMLCS